MNAKPRPNGAVAERLALSPVRQAVALLAAMALPLAAAVVGGWLTSRSVDDWYATIRKPAWTPPGAFIGTVWTVLYTLMGLSLWLVWRTDARREALRREVGRAYAAFGLQLSLNVLWSAVFFGLRSIVGGLAVIVPLWFASLGWARAAGEVQPLAGRLQLPYLAWVTFASLLNAVLAWMNRARPGS